MNLYIALLHYPVCNRAGQVVTTSVANMDIHDIARAAKTYGVRKFFIVTPIIGQQELVGRILDHWQKGYGAEFNPARRDAFDLVELRSDLEEAIRSAREDGREVKLVATGAGFKEDLMTHEVLKKLIALGCESYMLLFGTGSGLASGVVNRADYRLEPINGVSGYNHLSVRSAVAITLDRLMGGKT